MEDGRYYPQNNLTPSQAMVILMRTIGGRQDESVSPWWSSYMALATRHGIVPESDSVLIASGTTITKEKILSWIYNATTSTTLKSDPAIASASASMFGSAEFLGQPKVTPVVVQVVPAKNIAPLPKTDMSMKYDSSYAMNMSGACDARSFLCQWF
jgi:hypothetical protein